MRVNYTKYDMRRDQDLVNARNHADVMMYAPEGSDHPYLYARVLSVFHVQAFLLAPGMTRVVPQRLQVCWVRWFDLDADAPGGFMALRLYQLKWAHVDDGAFDFVDPDNILRGCHLIPKWTRDGVDRSNDALPGASMARRERDGGFEDD